MIFRRFLLRSTLKADTEWTVLSIACSILKLCQKFSSGRSGTHLVVPDGSPAGL